MAFRYFSKACLASVIFSNSLWASDSIVLGLFGTELTQVVTPSKIPQTQVDISSSLSVLDRAFIERSGARTVADLLQFVPGFVAGPYDDAADYVVSYHGTQNDKFRRMQVLVNGRSVFSAGLARVEWTSLPLNIEDVERIEVNRGPNAASYGANSFFAVINIITRAPQDTLGGTVNTYYDERGDSNLYTQYSDLSGPWSYRASFSTKNVEGFDVDEDGNDRRDGYDSTMANMYVIHEQGSRRIALDLGGANTLAKKDLSTDVYEYKAPDEEVDRAYIKLDWSDNVSPRHALSVHYYYEESLSDEKRYVDLPSGAYGLIFGETSATNVVASYVNDLDEYRHDIELQSNYEVNDDLHIVNVLSYRYDEVTSSTFLQGTRNDELLRLSSSLEYQYNQGWLVNTGYMLETSKLNGVFLSPKFGVTRLLRPNESLRFNYSKAIRTSDIFDEYARWNVTLDSGEVSGVTYADQGEKPELIESYEVGYFYDMDQWGITADLRLYHDDIDNLVVSGKVFEIPSTPGGDTVITERSTIDITIEGAEFELDWRSDNDTLARFTYAYQDTQTDVNKVFSTVTPESYSFLLSTPISDRLKANGRYFYGRKQAAYDYKNLNVWLSGNIPLNFYQVIHFGVGLEKRLDDNPYILKKNHYQDDSFYYGFVGIKF